MKRRLCSLALALAVCAVAAAAAQVPRKSPEFAVMTNSGQQVLLSQHRGKVVALLFILTYCPHCQVTVQALTRLQNEYGPRGFQVVASAIEDMANMYVPDFIKRYQPSFPVGFNNRDQVISYLQHPSMLKLLMPQLVFVDREGVIRAQYTGDDPFFGADQEKNLRQKIEELLKGGKPAAGGRNPSTSTRKAKKK